MKNYYKTIVISDLYLGARESKTKEAINFLKQSECENLILNGDIIDGRKLGQPKFWKQKHIKFFSRLLKMVNDNNTKITYVTGNVDNYNAAGTPFFLGYIDLCDEFIYESNGKKYYVAHGDIFDLVQKRLWLTRLGQAGLEWAVWLGERSRKRAGLLANRTASTLHHGAKHFEGFLSRLAKMKNCQGVICGHTLQPAIKKVKGVEYLNAGDWIKSLSALVETTEGDWRIVYYSDSGKRRKPVSSGKSIINLQAVNEKNLIRKLKTNAG